MRKLEPLTLEEFADLLKSPAIKLAVKGMGVAVPPDEIKALFSLMGRRPLAQISAFAFLASAMVVGAIKAEMEEKGITDADFADFEKNPTANPKALALMLTLLMAEIQVTDMGSMFSKN